jgi:hypothetical protein
MRAIMASVIMLGCIGVGGLIGLGLTELSTHGTPLKLISILIGSAVFLALFLPVKWFGLLDARGIASALVYSGMILWVILHYSAKMHRPWWITLPLAGICILLGIVRGVGPSSNSHLEPGDRISFRSRILLGDRGIAYILAEREALRRLGRLR